MPSTYTLISSNVLTSSAASVTFSAIPSTYTDLVLRVSVRSDSSGNKDYKLLFNSTASSNGSWTAVFGNGSSPGTFRGSGVTYVRLGNLQGTDTTSSTFTSIESYIPSYTSSQNKPMSSFSATENNATAARIDAFAGLWSDTSAINRIDISPDSGNFVSGSSFYLYGIKNS